MILANILLLAGGSFCAEPIPAADVPKGPALTLAEAEQNALRNQPTVRQSRGQTEAAAGRVEEARAGYLPQVSATATYYLERHGSLSTTTMPGTQQTTSGTGSGIWLAGVSASQLIYDFNATADRWRSAAANREAAASTERATALAALLGVRRAYFTARAERDLARVAEEAVANQQRHLDQIQALVQAGMRSQIDLATQRTALANARVQAVTTENTYAADLALLNQAMGLPGGDVFELTDTGMTPVPGEDGDEARMIESALKARPEVTSAEEQRRAQDLLVESYRGTYLPAVSAIAGLSEAGAGTDRSPASWYLGLGATWAILQGGLTHGQVREAKGTLAAIDAQAEAVRLQVSVDVVQGRLAVRGAKSTIDGAEEALTNAREQLRLAEARYQTGQGSVIELADAQVAYTTAEAQEVSARYNLAAARAQLLAAMGAGAEAEGR